MSFVPLRPEIAQKVLDQRLNDHETQQWVGEVNLYDEDTKKSKPRYVLVTEACLYIFSRDVVRGSKTTKPDSTDSFFELQDSSVSGDDCYLKFKATSYHFITAESAALCTNIMAQFRRLLWNVNPSQVGITSPLLTRPVFLDVPAPKRRPPNVIIHRYVSCCVAKEFEIEDTVLEVFRRYTAEPRKVIGFSNFELKNPMAALFAVSFEGDISGITLDNCSPHNLGQMLNWVLLMPNRFTTLDLRNYDNAQFRGMPTRRSVFSHLKVIRFHSCGTAFISGFLQSVKGANYTFDTIVFDTIRFEAVPSRAFLNALQTFPVFSALLSLAFVGCSCSNSPFAEFATQCLQARDTLTFFQAESCGIDICEMLIEIAKLEDSHLQIVNLRGNRGMAPVSHEDTLLRGPLLWLNLGESRWAAPSFRAFVAELCRRRRRSPIALWLDSSHVDVPWAEVFDGLPLESLEPVITELNFSRNSLDARAFELFGRFLATQAPLLASAAQPPNRLAHLNISHCFGADSDASITRLFAFFEARELWGLEICGLRPDARLAAIRGLHALNIGESEFDATAAHVLYTFVKESPTIAEIGVSDIDFGDVSALMSFYLSLLAVPRVLAFDHPTALFQKYPQFNETKKIRELLNHTRDFSNTTERLQLFLSLAGDFATRVPRPPTITDDEDGYASPLFEANFINPIPSLFTLATISTVDVNVEPIASMVAEYVATSGKYGIVPPTAPPPAGPVYPMTMPAIYATMQSAAEHESDFDVPFDPYDPTLQQLSYQMAVLLKQSLGALDINGAPETWSQARALMVFDPLETQQ